jgi:hypothetical protein
MHRDASGYRHCGLFLGLSSCLVRLDVGSWQHNGVVRSDVVVSLTKNFWKTLLRGPMSSLRCLFLDFGVVISGVPPADCLDPEQVRFVYNTFMVRCVGRSFWALKSCSIVRASLLPYPYPESLVDFITKLSEFAIAASLQNSEDAI